MIKAKGFLLFFVLSLAFGVIYMKYMYSYIFHADASAMQILAQAMVDTKSIITHDFYYGNQLIFLRSSSTIALALALGYSSYNAFIAGSALSIAIWSTVFLFSINYVVKSPRIAILFVVCALFPISSSYDGDYILGQQSHLANVVCSFSFIALLYKFLKEGGVVNLYLSLVFIELISIETPIRGAFVALTAIAVINIFFERKKSIPTSIVITITMILSYLINKALLINFGIAQDIVSDSRLASLDALIENIKFISHDYLIASSPMNLLGGRKILSTASVFYFCGLAYMISITAYMLRNCYLSIKLVVNFQKIENISFFDFIKASSGIGLIITVLSILILNPDSSRHAIWAFFIMKICFFRDAYNYLCTRIGKSGLLVLVVFVLLSSSFLNYIIFNDNAFNNVYSKNSQKSIREIENDMRANNVNSIYSTDFWSVMQLGTLVSGLRVGVILPNQSNEFSPFRWLSRPSTFQMNVDGNVLYLVKSDEHSHDLLLKINSVHGVKLSSNELGDIWMAKPIWNNY